MENPLGDEHGIAEDGDSFSIGQQLNRSLGNYTLFYEDSEIDCLSEKGNGVLQIFGANKKGICLIEKIGDKVLRDNLITNKAIRIRFNYKKIKEKFSDEKFAELQKKAKMNSFNICFFLDKIVGFEKICFESEEDLKRYNKKHPLKISFIDKEGKKMESYPDDFSLFMVILLLIR